MNVTRMIGARCHKMVWVGVLAVALAMACGASQKKTYRDSNGHIIGVATTDSMGRTTYRDSNGMLIGTARTDGNEFYLFFGRYESVLGSS